MAPFARTLLRPHIVRNAVRVSLVVGTILNVVNQGENVWNGEPISWLHAALNYLVPYCVASYSATKNELQRR